MRGNYLFGQQLDEYELNSEAAIRAIDTNSPLFDELLNLEGFFNEEQTSNFGLFDEQSEDEITFIGQEISSKRNVGALLNWYLEAGLMNDIVLGLRQDFRIYPNSYKQQCVKFNSFQVYLRLKLFSKS